MPTGRTSYVAVVGPGEATGEQLQAAEEIGAALAAGGAVVVTGGLGGVMEAACRGARSKRGLTVGLLPGVDREAANGWVEVALATGLDVLIAVGGSAGTLSEIGFGLKLGKPVVGLKTFDVHGVEQAVSPADAVQRALRHLTQ
jgi:uncharacterized protein (TIGR00725 family)